MAYMAGWRHDAGYAFAPTRRGHAEAGGVILVDAGASFADAVRSRGGPGVPPTSGLLLIVNTAGMMCGSDGVPVSFDERLADVEARYGAGCRQAVDVGAMLSVLRRELEMRGVSVEAAERAGVERAGEAGESAESVEGAAVAGATADTGVSDAEGEADSLYALLTAFHAPDRPSTRFVSARPSAGRTGRFSWVLACGACCWRVEALSCGRIRGVAASTGGGRRAGAHVARPACVECILGGVLAESQTCGAFVARPSRVLDLNGGLLDSAPVLVGACL